MQKGKDWRDFAPGDIVRRFEAATGIVATAESLRGGVKHVTLVPGQLELVIRGAGTRVDVIASVEYKRAHPALCRFLIAQSVHGVVSGYTETESTVMQTIDIMPRYADDVLAACVAPEGIPALDPWQRMETLPESFLSGLDASEWDVELYDYHPALANPAPVSVLSNAGAGVELIFAVDGVWVGLRWPFRVGPLHHICSANGKYRCLVPKGDGWQVGWWQNAGQGLDGVMYSKWADSLATLKMFVSDIQGPRPIVTRRPTINQPAPAIAPHQSGIVH